MRTAILFQQKEVFSTQDIAKAWLQNERALNAITKQIFFVRAESQRAGRGRAGRSWLNSKPGDSLLLSAAFFTENSSITPTLLPLFSGWIFYQYLTNKFAGLSESLSIKWPNDLGIFDSKGDFRKLCGVLCESPFRNAFIVGWGANIHSSPKDFPSALNLEELCLEKPSQTPLNIEEIFNEFSQFFTEELSRWELAPEEYEKLLIKNLKEGPMKKLWKRLGKLESGELAQAIDLNNDGALVVKRVRDDQIKNVYAGDFSFTNQLEA